MAHLWEIDHPFYGPDDSANECETFDELRQSVNRLDEGMNHIYRWDWIDYSQPMHDDLFLEDEERGKQTFTVFLVLPRKSMLINFTCPVTHEQEHEIREWLQSDRVLGALRRHWEPLLELAEGEA